MKKMILEFEKMGLVVNLSLDLFNLGGTGEKTYLSIGRVQCSSFCQSDGGLSYGSAEAFNGYHRRMRWIGRGCYFGSGDCTVFASGVARAADI